MQTQTHHSLVLLGIGFDQTKNYIFIYLSNWIQISQNGDQMYTHTDTAR